MKYYKGCAIKRHQQKGNTVLLHCCNAQGVMGAGIARQIKLKYPKTYRAYLESHNLGDVSYDEDDMVMNLTAQEYVGTDQRQVHYGHLSWCLFKVKGYLNFIHKNIGEEPVTVVIPYKMASDLAGGDWEVVRELCEVIFKEFNIEVWEL